VVVGFHFTFPLIGHVEKDGAKYRLIPSAWHPTFLRATFGAARLALGPGDFAKRCVSQFVRSMHLHLYEVAG
jgi:hypothetical protein